MGEEGLSISDKKQVKVDVFEEADLISDEEKAALNEDIEGDPDNKTDSEAEAAAKADADQKAQEEADAEKQAEVERADKAIADQKAEADAKAEVDRKAAEAGADPGDKDQKGEAGGEAGSQGATDNDPPIIVPQTAPPLAMAAMTADEVEAINTRMIEVRKQFSDGEIDYDKYFEERLGLERQLWQNDIAVQLSSDGVENQWKWEQQSFLTSSDNEWINSDDVVYSAFAATVNRIMSTEEGAVMPGPELLAQAREEVAARFSPTKAEDSAAAAEKKKAAAAKAKVKAQQAGKKIPDTLGGAPAAELEDGVGEFDYLDKLEGDAFERAVEGLSEAQLARYESIQ